MGRIKLDAEQKRQLQKNAVGGGWSITDLENVDEQPWSFYYNPQNGKEMWLPCDAWNLQHYRMKGYKQGRLPENIVPSDNMFKEKASQEVLPTDIATIVKNAVETALKAAGVALPASNQETIVSEPEPKKPVQLRML